MSLHLQKVSEEQVLRGALDEGKSVLLVYASARATDPAHNQPLPAPLVEFIQSDNRAFAAEFANGGNDSGNDSGNGQGNNATISPSIENEAGPDARQGYAPIQWVAVNSPDPGAAVMDESHDQGTASAVHNVERRFSSSASSNVSDGKATEDIEMAGCVDGAEEEKEQERGQEQEQEQEMVQIRGGRSMTLGGHSEV
ncbi:MAG: hypothetical protein M1826_005496 [Phylliscum demangeonii]|nr:MAG: hypothetical protein M1826_005496 [Phylliscum demangeonii]